MPLYNGNYEAPVWVNGVPPTIGESELLAISTTVQFSQVLTGSGPPTAQTVGTVGQRYADTSTTPYTFYVMKEESESGYVWGPDENLDGNLALDYDSTETYEEGKYCIHEGKLYRCTTAIPTAEAWTAAHWTQVLMAEEAEDHFASTNNPHSVTKTQIGLGNLTNDRQYSPAYPAQHKGSIRLSGSWTLSGSNYQQTVTVTGATVTSNSHVEMQFTPEQAQALLYFNISYMYVSNSSGTLTVISVGGKTTDLMTVQCTVTEQS